jgi:uncharacterized membrane protein HdeD (DUF308 family)
LDVCSNATVGEVALAGATASGSCPPGDDYCTMGQAIDDALIGDVAALFFFVCLAVWVAGLGVINFVVWLRERREDQRLINALAGDGERESRQL